MSIRMKVCGALLGAAVIAAAGPAYAGKLDMAIADYRLGHYDSAFARFQELSKDNDPKAAYWTAVMYHKGRGSSLNYEEAVRYYLVSATRGHKDAQNNLGLMFRDGLGVEDDKAEAFAWFSIAQSRGSRIARNNLDNLTKEMDSTEIARGLRRAKQLRGHIAAVSETHARQLARRFQAEPAKAAPTETRPVPAPPVAKAPAPTPAPVPRVTESHDLAEVDSGEVSSTDTTLSGITRQDAVSVQASEELYMVQLGTFASPKGIARIHEVAASTGLSIEDELFTGSGRNLHRLRVGPFTSMAEAAQAKTDMDRLLRVKSVLVPASF